MNSRDHANRHLLALPSWKQEQLEREANDTTFNAAHNFTLAWRDRQEAEHATDIKEQG
jgi:hypothetical protein